MISSDELEGSSSARLKLDKGKGKASLTNIGSDSEYEDLKGEVKIADDLKVGQPKVDSEEIENLKQRLVPIYRQMQLTHIYYYL